MNSYRLIAFLFIFLWNSWVLLTTRFDGLFWDFGVYTRAMQDYLEGANPYRTGSGLTFVYHPYILKALTWSDGFVPLPISFPLLYCLATVLFVSSVLQFVRDNKDEMHQEGALMSFLLVFGAGMTLGGAGLSSLRTGNLTTFLHFLVLGAFLWSVRYRGNFIIAAFVAILIMSAVLKPYFLAYVLLLPYLFDRVRAGAVFILVVAAAAVVWFSAIRVTPDLWSQFVAALSHQTIGLWDLGYSVFGVTATYVGTRAAIVIHAVVILAVCIGGAHIFLRKGYPLFDVRLIPFWSVVAIFANPRMKEYDFCVAMILFFAFIYIHSTAKTLQAILVGLGVSAVPVINLKLANLGFPVSVVLMPSLQIFQLLAFALMLPLAMTSLERRE